MQGHSNGFCKHGPIRLKLIWIKELERPGFNEIDILIEIFHLYVIKKEDMQSCILKAMLFFMHNSFITGISWRPSTES